MHTNLVSNILITGNLGNPMFRQGGEVGVAVRTYVLATAVIVESKVNVECRTFAFLILSSLVSTLTHDDVFSCPFHSL